MEVDNRRDGNDEEDVPSDEEEGIDVMNSDGDSSEEEEEDPEEEARIREGAFGGAILLKGTSELIGGLMNVGDQASLRTRTKTASARGGGRGRRERTRNVSRVMSAHMHVKIAETVAGIQAPTKHSLKMISISSSRTLVSALSGQR